MRKLLLVVALVGLTGAAVAAEVGGVKVADTASVGGNELVLNGAGIRSRAIFKVYVGSLYLPKKSADATAAIGGEGAKRVQINMLRNVSADDFAEAAVRHARERFTSAHCARRVEAAYEEVLR